MLSACAPALALTAICWLLMCSLTSDLSRLLHRLQQWLVLVAHRRGLRRHPARSGYAMDSHEARLALIVCWSATIPLTLAALALAWAWGLTHAPPQQITSFVLAIALFSAFPAVATGWWLGWVLALAMRLVELGGGGGGDDDQTGPDGGPRGGLTREFEFLDRSRPGPRRRQRQAPRTPPRQRQAPHAPTQPRVPAR